MPGNTTKQGGFTWGYFHGLTILCPGTQTQVTTTVIEPVTITMINLYTCQISENHPVQMSFSIRTSHPIITYYIIFTPTSLDTPGMLIEQVSILRINPH